MKLIVGGDSAIGKALAGYWNVIKVPYCSSTRRPDFVSADRPYVNLATKEWENLKSVRYDSALFCAAESKIAKCEAYPDETRQVNVEATYSLASQLNMLGSHVLLLSSTKVLDGDLQLRRGNGLLSPKTEYGRQKAEAEAKILKLQKSAVLRISKVIYPELPLLKGWDVALRSGRSIFPFYDMYLDPVYLSDVVLKIHQIIVDRSTGIFHLSSRQKMSYFEFALDYFKNIEGSSSLIKATSAKAAGIPDIYLGKR